MAQQMLLDRFAPACVMIDRKLQVLYVHGLIENYLTFPAGELTTRVVDMAREGLRARLRGAIGKCIETGRPVSITARVRRGEKSVPVKATVSPLRHPRETDGLLLITFEDSAFPAVKSRPARPRGTSDVRQLEDELKITREELQSTIEQLESSNDQLKASNEEVTAANEELQSANEEMETSKEELQSLNEELNTINVRLQEKVDELESANNDVVNLLSSTSIATVFLDKELKIKRYTPAITRLMSLIPSDVGRPIGDILLRFTDEALLDDARRVLVGSDPSLQGGAGRRRPVVHPPHHALPDAGRPHRGRGRHLRRRHRPQDRPRKALGRIPAPAGGHPGQHRRRLLRPRPGVALHPRQRRGPSPFRKDARRDARTEVSLRSFRPPAAPPSRPNTAVPWRAGSRSISRPRSTARRTGSWRSTPIPARKT